MWEERMMERVFAILLKKCPKCRSELERKGEYLVCPKCGFKIKLRGREKRSSITRTRAKKRGEEFKIYKVPKYDRRFHISLDESKIKERLINVSR